MRPIGVNPERDRRNRRLWATTLGLIRSGVPTTMAIRATGISRRTFFRWQARERDLAETMRTLTD
jgi:DNA invertase Pin-like site-specific DNA recombinase